MSGRIKITLGVHLAYLPIYSILLFVTFQAVDFGLMMKKYGIDKIPVPQGIPKELYAIVIIGSYISFLLVPWGIIAVLHAFYDKMQETFDPLPSIKSNPDGPSLEDILKKHKENPSFRT